MVFMCVCVYMCVFGCLWKKRDGDIFYNYSLYILLWCLRIFSSFFLVWDFFELWVNVIFLSLHVYKATKISVEKGESYPKKSIYIKK